MDLTYTVLIQLIIFKTATLFVLIDEEMETEMVIDEEEEEEDEEEEDLMTCIKGYFKDAQLLLF